MNSQRMRATRQAAALLGPTEPSPNLNLAALGVVNTVVPDGPNKVRACCVLRAPAAGRCSLPPRLLEALMRLAGFQTTYLLCGGCGGTHRPARPPTTQASSTTPHHTTFPCLPCCCLTHPVRAHSCCCGSTHAAWLVDCWGAVRMYCPGRCAPLWAARAPSSPCCRLSSLLPCNTRARHTPTRAYVPLVCYPQVFVGGLPTYLAEEQVRLRMSGGRRVVDHNPCAALPCAHTYTYKALGGLPWLAEQLLRLNLRPPRRTAPFQNTNVCRLTFSRAALPYRTPHSTPHTNTPLAVPRACQPRTLLAHIPTFACTAPACLPRACS